MYAGTWRLLLLPLLAACNGTTGYELVSFYAAARGAPDAVKGQPYTFDLDAHQRVTLTKATLHVGALYLTQGVPTSGGGPAPCVLPGTYNGVFVGQVLLDGGDDIDLLDPSLQPLSAPGEGSTIPAVTGQVWLTRGDVNAPGDPAAVSLEGSVVVNGATATFSGGIALEASAGASTTTSAASDGLPGENQICLVRIVQGVPAALTLAQGGTLVLAVDPRALLDNANFARQGSSVELSGNATDQSNQPSRNLFDNVKSTGAYRFEWLPPTH
jgi:hypothetical protein